MPSILYIYIYIYIYIEYSLHLWQRLFRKYVNTVQQPCNFIEKPSATHVSQILDHPNGVLELECYVPTAPFDGSYFETPRNHSNICSGACALSAEALHCRPKSETHNPETSSHRVYLTLQPKSQADRQPKSEALSHRATPNKILPASNPAQLPSPEPPTPNPESTSQRPKSPECNSPQP